MRSSLRLRILLTDGATLKSGGDDKDGLAPAPSVGSGSIACSRSSERAAGSLQRDAATLGGRLQPCLAAGAGVVQKIKPIATVGSAQRLRVCDGLEGCDALRWRKRPSIA